MERRNLRIRRESRKFCPHPKIVPDQMPLDARGSDSRRCRPSGMKRLENGARSQGRAHGRGSRRLEPIGERAGEKKTVWSERGEHAARAETFFGQRSAHEPLRGGAPVG